MGDVVLRLKGDCADHFSPIGGYVRIIGLKMVNLRSMLTDEIIDQLIEVFKDWSTLFRAYPLSTST